MIKLKDIIPEYYLEEDENPCWKGYEMVGTKMKNGKEVPNCVPIKEGKLSEWKPTKIKSFTDTHKDLMKLGFGNLIVSYDGIKKKVKDLKPRDIKGEDDLMIMKTLNTLHKKNLIRFDGKNFDITVNGQKNMRGTLKLEGKLTEKKQGYVVASIYGDLYTPKAVSEKKALKMLDNLSKWGGDKIFMLGVEAWNKPHKLNKKKEMVKEDWRTEKNKWSSKEAKNIMDDSLRMWSKDLKQVKYRVIKDWMSKAKAGVLDFFDIEKGLTVGDVSRAHPQEVELLHDLLIRDKIIDRFRSYFGGKKAMNNRLTKKRR